MNAMQTNFFEPIDIQNVEQLIDNVKEKVYIIHDTPFIVVYKKQTQKYHLVCCRTEVGKAYNNMPAAVLALNMPSWGMICETMYAIAKAAIDFKMDERAANAQGQSLLTQ